MKHEIIPVIAAVAYSTEPSGPVWVSQDHEECVRAFFEKRTPVLTGK